MHRPYPVQSGWPDSWGSSAVHLALPDPDDLRRHRGENSSSRVFKKKKRKKKGDVDSQNKYGKRELEARGAWTVSLGPGPLPRENC